MSGEQTGRDQYKILSIVQNRASACYELNQSTNFRCSKLVVE